MALLNERADSRPACTKCGKPLPSGVFGTTCARCQLSSALSVEEYRSGEWPAALMGGAQVGEYELIEEIGRGGMGIVYRARQRSLNRVVALKMTPAGPGANPEFVRRLRAEAEMIAGLRHENIVTVHEIGESDGRLYFSMDYIAGTDLAELVRNRPMSPNEAAMCLQAVAEAVAHAHAHGVVHRDLKPSNIIMDGLGQPHITDFGLAKSLAADSEMTRTGQMLGSPSFCAPEQAGMARGQIGPGCDIHALGGILYYLLTGRPPYLGETLEETLWQVLRSDPVSPRLLDRRIPLDLETICLKCLEKNPARRYASAAEVAAELGRFLRGETIHARPLGAVGKLWRWCLRNPGPAGLALVVVLLLLAVAVVTSVANARLQRQQTVTTQAAYAADIRLAHWALNSGNYGLVDRYLVKYRPENGPHHLRGWEWRYLWGQSRPESLFRLGRHTNSVSAIGMSPDGHRLVSGSIDGSLVIWDAAARKELAAAWNSQRITAIAYSPSGSVVAGDTHGTIRFYDGETLAEAMEPMRLAPDAKGPVLALRFSAGGGLAAVIAEAPGRWLRSHVGRWDLSTRELLSSQEIPGGQVAAFSPAAMVVATGGPNGELWLSNLESGEAQRTSWNGHANSITALAFSPEGRHLATGGVDKLVKIWSLEAAQEPAPSPDADARMESMAVRGRPELVSELAGFNGRISAAGFSPDGRLLAAGSYDQTIQVWETGAWRPLALFKGQMSPILCLDISPDSRYVVTGSGGGTMRVWDTKSPPPVRAFTRLSPDGRVRAAGPAGAVVMDAEGTVSLLEFPSGTETWRVNLSEMNPSAWALSADGGWVAAGTDGGELYFWNTSESAEPRRMRVDRAGISHLKYSMDGKRLAVAIGGERIEVLSFSAEPSAIFECEHALVVDFEFSPDGQLLAVADEDGRALVWNVDRGKLIHVLVGNEFEVRMTALAFSPDGLLLAASSENSDVHLWDVRLGRKKSKVLSRGNAPRSLSWSPDGRRLAGGIDDSTVLIWDVTSGHDLLALGGHAYSTVGVVFLPDGDNLVSYCVDELFLWQAPPMSR